MSLADWLQIAARLALYVILAALFGLAAFSLFGLREAEREDAFALRPWLITAAWLALALSALSLLTTASVMAGVSPWPVNWEALAAVLSGTAFGIAWKVRAAALFVAAGAAMLARGRPGWLACVLLAAATSLVTLAWSGHGAAGEGNLGWVRLGADILHLLAAGIWVGALIALLLLLFKPVDRVDSDHLLLTHRALHGFGAVGTLVVTTLVATGVLNAWLLTRPDTLSGIFTTWGLLLLAKLALFGGMLLLAALNRFRLTPGFEAALGEGDHRRALMRLRLSLAVETGLVLSILALVAWLGTLEPTAAA